MPILQFSYILGLTVSLKFINISFQIFLFLLLKCLLVSHLTFFRLSTWLRFGSCNHCILACFLGSKKFKHSASKHGLCCFITYRRRLYLAEVFIFYLMFSQALLMSSLSFKFSKAAKLFDILIWYHRSD